MSIIKKTLPLFLILLTFTHIYSQTKKKKVMKAECTTFIYNLTSGSMKMKDICYKIELTDHIDSNETIYHKKWDRKKDYWKYSISINDNETKSKQTFNASFYIYDENEERIQYHCIYDDYDIKCLIYDKTRNCWLILILQNDDFKMLSCYTGYNYINAFDIKERKSSSIQY